MYLTDGTTLLYLYGGLKQNYYLAVTTTRTLPA